MSAIKIIITPPYYAVGYAALICDPGQDFITRRTFQRAFDKCERAYQGDIQNAKIGDVEVIETPPTIAYTEPGYIYVQADKYDLMKHRNSEVVLLRLICSNDDGGIIQKRNLDMTINLRQLGYGLHTVYAPKFDTGEMCAVVSTPDPIYFDRVDIPDYIQTNYLQRLSYE